MGEPRWLNFFAFPPWLSLCRSIFCIEHISSGSSNLLHQPFGRKNTFAGTYLLLPSPYFSCFSLLLTVCLSALDLQGAISFHALPSRLAASTMIISCRYISPCKLHNAVLTSVTSLRVLSYNYSSFPLSLLASRASPSPTYIKHAQTRTLWTHGRHSPLQTIIFLQARWTYLHNTTFFSLSTRYSLLLLHYATTVLYSHFATSKTTPPPNCDWKDWHSTP